MKDIITLDDYGVIERNGIPVVSSLRLAHKFEKRHDDVLKAIENALETLEEADLRNFAEIAFTKTTYKDANNRRQPCYDLTRDGYSFIAMGFTGEKAAVFKVAYITLFNDMELFIKSLLAAKMEFPEYTNAVMQAHDEPKHYHFSTENDMINRIVIGMSAKQFKEINGLPKDTPSIRPYLTTNQVIGIVSLQRADIGLLLSKIEYEKRKEILTNYHAQSLVKQLAS